MMEYKKPEIELRRFDAELLLEASAATTAETRARTAMADELGSDTMSAYIVREW